MSFSVLPVAAPSPVAGAAPSAGGAVAGFEALLAALVGGPVAAPAPALGKAPSKDAAPGELAGEPGEESSAETEAQLLVPEALVAAAVAAPAPPAPPTPKATTDTVLPDSALIAPSGASAIPVEAGAGETAQMVAAMDVPQTEIAADGLPEGEVVPDGQTTEAAPRPEAKASGAADPVNPRTATPDLAALLQGGRAIPAQVPPAAPAPPITAAAVQPVEGEAVPAAPQSVTPGTAPAAASPSAALMAAAAAAGARSVQATGRNEAPTPATSAPKEARIQAAGPADPLRPSPFALASAGLISPPTVAAPPLQTLSPDSAPVDTAQMEPAPQVEGADLPDTVSSPAPAAQTESASRAASAPVQATPATVADLAAQMARKLQAKTSHFDIQLSPEGLGRVDVRVDIDAQGKLTAAMAFDNPQAANELRGRAGELQKALEQAGFDMSGGMSFQSPDDQRGGFAQQQSEREGASGRAFASALGVADSAEIGAATQAYRGHRSPSGVDVRI